MAYTNFQNCTQEEYNEIIYSGDAKHRLKLLFNGVEYPTANSKTESIKRIGKILSDGGERFSLDNFKAQTLELIIHDIDLEDIQEPISISIGTLVDDENDTYEYVPIGIFNLDETPTTSSDKTTIKVSDNASKFDFLYDASGVIEKNGGEATMLQILQDICNKAEVTLETTDFPNMNTKVSVWDNSINARQYVMYIGEKAGRIPNISRTGGLILIDLQSNETVEVESEDGIIEIDDALARTPEDLQLQGNTTQQTYTGKNLCGIPDQTFTHCGVQVTIKNGEITLNGTSTSTGTKQLTPIKTTTLNGTYVTNYIYVSGTSSTSVGATGNFNLRNANGGAVISGTQLALYTNNSKAQFTISSDTSIIFGIYIQTIGVTYNNLKFKPQLIKGTSEDYSYEPYVGGTPSPNPDYPQAINNVTGRQTIDVVGKNLWGGISFTKNVNGLVLTTNTNGTITVDGTASANTTSATMAEINANKLYVTLKAGTYTVKGGKSDKQYLEIYDINNNFIAFNKTTGSTTFTLSEDKNVTIRVYIANGEVLNNETFEIMLEKGSTSTTYEEYKGQSYEINLGKNLFDKDNANLINAYLNPTGTKISSGSGVKTLYISCKPNTTYTVSKVQSDRFVVATGTSVEPNSVMTNFVANYTATNITVTSGANDKYLVVFFYRQSGDTLTPEEIMDTIQIETGSQATSYSPYFTPIELNKIGNYKDYIRKSTGKNLLNQVESGGFNTTTGEKNTGNFYRNSEPIQVQPNTTYIFSINGTGTAINVLGYKADMTYTGLVSGSTISANQSFTIPDDVKYINIFRGTSTGNQNWQIEKSSTITSYEPYLPIGTWYIEKKIGKVVYNGTENWNTNTTSANKPQYYLSMAGYLAGQLSYTNMFVYNNQATALSVENSMYIGGSNIVIVNPTQNGSSIATTSDFKNLLNNNNLIVYYVLKTPTYTEITNEELINQLESIELLNGINNIMVSSGDLAGGLKITYDKINDGIELDPLLFEKYTEGDLLEITRVVYEDAIRKFEYGDETGATLYINSANPYIVDASEIYNIYLQVRGLSLYSMKISKMIGNPALDPWDIIKFTYKNKEYRTLAQNTLTYNGVITQSFDTQIGTKEKSQENVTINSGDANFKRLYARMDQAEGNIELNASQVSSVQSDLKENYFDKTSTEQLILNSANGLTNTFSEAGGNNIFRNTGLWFESGDSNNPYEFWTGIVVKDSNNLATNRNCLKLQSGTLFQEEQVPNGNYTISFKYKKLIPLANVKCVINDTEYTLSETTDTDFQQTITTSTNIKVQFISDTDNACEVYDLMVNAGEVKLAYSQNQNETTTDTVNISKGITITSSDDANTIFKANYDGIRIYEKNNMTTPKTEFTKKGTETNYLEVKDEAVVVDILIQRVGSQTWLTKI